MSYIYEEQKAWVFTDEGQRQFLRIRDKVCRLLSEAGAVRMQEALRGEPGSSWDMLACVDRLVELEELKELTVPFTPGQCRVFVKYYS